MGILGEQPITVWFTVGQAIALTASSLTLSIQRAYAYRQHSHIEGTDKSSPLQRDSIRDIAGAPFLNGYRLTRINLETLFLAIVAVYTLQIQVQTPSSQENLVAKLIGPALTLIAWMYSLALSLTSVRHPLPSALGWTLNLHLFLVYTVLWFSSIGNLIYEAIWLSSNLPSYHLLSLWLPVIIGADLVFSTATVKNGSPFLDANGKQVSGNNVESIFGILFFNWLTPIVNLVNIKGGNMEQADLPTLPVLHRAYNLFYIFGETRGRNLILRLILGNRSALAKQTLFCVLCAIAQFGQPLFLNKLLLLIQNTTNGEGADSKQFLLGLTFIIGMSVSGTVDNLLTSHTWYYAESCVEVRVKSMLNLDIYRKTLRRMDTSVLSGNKKASSSSSLKSSKDDADKNEVDEDQVSSLTGLVMNVMSVDSAKISEFSCWWFVGLSAPLQLAIGIYFLYTLLGWSCILGTMAIVVTLPLNHINTKIFAKAEDNLMAARDKRVSLMNEVLQGIRQIKFFAWESNWTKRILEARAVELGYLAITCTTDVVFKLLWQGTPLLITTISFWSFTKLEGRELTAPIAFTSLAIFHELEFALTIIPEFFIRMVDTYVSVKRVEKYLAEDEISPSSSDDALAQVKIGFENATIGWPTSSIGTTLAGDDDSGSETSTLNHQEGSETSSFTLKGLNTTFPNNKLSLICGPTGSGKTLLMLSLLGETETKEGSVYCPRSTLFTSLDNSTAITSFKLTSDSIVPPHWILDQGVAYVSQTPWLQNATIKNNILFGLPYAAKRYQATITACALDKDLSYLEDGDETEIGEKGITLSGGQKARVALARAVYSRAQNVLMDNVVSAVDAHTAKHIYEKCFLGPLMKGRTQILITHHINMFIEGSDHVILVKEGRIQLSGSPDELKANGQMALLLAKQIESQAAKNDKAEIAEDANTIDGSSEDQEEQVKKFKPPKTLVEEEERAKGMVQMRLYRLYFKLIGGYFFWIIFFLLVFGSQGLQVGSSWWLKKWSQSYETKDTSNDTLSSTTWSDGSHQMRFFQSKRYTLMESNNISEEQKNSDLDRYLIIYAVINLVNIVIGSARHASIYWAGIKASKELYRILLERVFHAPLRFFDTTPTGRIINRFASDFEMIDTDVPHDLVEFMMQWVAIFAVVLVATTSLPILMIPMIFVGFINVYFGMRFLTASRELKRMDSVSRSPLFTQFSETIVGVTTIRAFGMTQRFMLDMLNNIDNNSRPVFYSWSSARWVSVRISIMGSAITLVTGIVILLNLNTLDAALAGFCLSYVSIFTDMTYWGVRRYTTLETRFNAIERVVEFSEMDQEADTVTNIRPPEEWPTQGAIEIKDLHVRYAADLEPVLKGLNVSIKPKEKIGIVGRTGSGKSTVVLSFFRFIEASQGSIVIDGIDIKEIGTEDLRSNLTIVPQDPVLFSGTLGSNMDPFNQFSNEEIFTALGRVQLLNDDAEGDINQNVFRDLETPVSEGGHNFSQGQRQLLCLARALLKRSKVVLMDEATASVDFETDKAIQKTITTEFSECTIICVAHRLNTVIEYDRILVLDRGEILEFASPLDLLSDSSSAFYKMCRNSGEFDNLVALAKAKHELVDVL